MHESANEMAQRLRADLAGVKLLAMGQTVFWDEPVKAVLRRVLDELSPETELLVGIHDADYFSRIRDSKNTGEFVLTGHDDGPARDLWVAAAETSQLFGGETVVTRALLIEYGVPVEKLAREEREENQGHFLSEATAAWGWRGVAMDAEEAPLCGAIAVRDVLPRLVELLKWATGTTASSLGSAESARVFAEELIGELEQAASRLPADAKLPDLYERLAESYWRRLLGRSSDGLAFCRATQLFRFNTQTASLPRFRLVDFFLNPKTRHIARRAYNEAVRDSDIYSLERFSEAALPFDLALLKKEGTTCRGTICIAENEVAILGPCSIVLHTNKPPASVSELALLVERHLGPDAILVGKAVPLVAMILSEWVFVLHKFGSAYTPLTKRMLAAMREAGLDVPLHPILRIEHDAWSAFHGSEAAFRLPPHLARAFGSSEITAAAFAEEWKESVMRVETLLDQLRQITNPEELTDFLGHDEHSAWLRKLRDYVKAHSKLLRLSLQIDRLRHQGIRMMNRAREAKAEIQRLEKEKGHIVRQHIRPLKNQLAQRPRDADALRRQLAAFERQKAEIEPRIADLWKLAKEAESESMKTDKAHHVLEESPEFVAARTLVAAVEREAHLLRLRLVRDALLTTRGLPYAAARPVWWWFPMVDPSGKWFDVLTDTAKFGFEEI